MGLNAYGDTASLKFSFGSFFVFL